ncbi:MAG: hypothetical protein HY553_21710 [Elusimicrobia bacterium]|nr:hypothetical protein [Elusimicrobiota bacterium]
MARNGNDGVDEDRIRRILEQAEAHGGLRRLPVPYAQRARLLPPKPSSSGGWEQLKFPWAV